MLPALRDLYDEIWVYGREEICDPLEGLDIPASVRSKMRYTGYLRREASSAPAPKPNIPFADDPFLLVTAGGGGDGEPVMDWVLRAYEHDSELPYPALLVLGPFMPYEQQTEFMDRASRLDRVHAITFDSRIEALMSRCAGIVAMGGYNTFCEILSFDKRALIVPRTEPRLEQYIRAKKAEEWGLLGMLVDDGDRSPRAMANALRLLPSRKRPSEASNVDLLGGLENVQNFVRKHLQTVSAAAGTVPFRRPA